MDGNGKISLSKIPGRYMTYKFNSAHKAEITILPSTVACGLGFPVQQPSTMICIMSMNNSLIFNYLNDEQVTLTRVRQPLSKAINCVIGVMFMSLM